MTDATFPTITLTSPHGTVRIAHNGAQILDASWNGRPLLWLSPLTNLRPGKAARGGVPVCFPWFGRHPVAGMPNHGFARSMTWQLSEQSADHAIFSLQDNAESFALWPHHFRAELKIWLNEALNVEFSVHNSSAAAFSFTYALHSYFAVGDSRECVLRGLDGRIRNEVGYEDHAQQGDITMPGLIDAVFENAPGLLQLDDQDCSIYIDAPAMRSCVVWNPGPELSDIHDIGEHWHEFVCVERGNIRGDAIHLAPGDTHRAAMHISVRSNLR